MNAKATTIDRRRLLLGTGATAAGLGAMSVLPATQLAETSCERVRRLAGELSEAMNEWNAEIGGIWKAHVYASSYRQRPIEFESLDEIQTPTAAAQKTAEVMAGALREIYGGTWRVTIEQDFALFARRAA
ncbi:hypothetical protein EOD10_20395 [Mesorhizobium sp. M7A.T.Ca.TU.009.01.3.2]|nr:hypothetical protein EOD10_20395 [Mesorhizobium sp. M7A.T.Ca.TU.009.01.3.2]